MSKKPVEPNPDYPGPLNADAPQTLDLLLSRRSASAKAMTGPGPDEAQLRKILAAGARVPDHGKLAPWRFILFEGDARSRFGAVLAECLALSEPQASAQRLQDERERFLRAPVVIGVVSRAREFLPIPLWEQQLSAGAVCQNTLLAAHAQGFGANWLTEWYAYDPCVLERLGLKPGERIAGFIYIGQPAETLEERPRPQLETILTRY
jgi:nitroreductase